MPSDQEYTRLQDILSAVRQQSQRIPRLALLLGTGLGAIADAIEVEVRIPYQQLPEMPVSTAESHAGELLLGTVHGISVVAFSGRLHCYEGYAAHEVVVPVRLARLLGAQYLIMGSAVGGLDPRLQVGDVVVLEDHINAMGVNPLVGPNDDRIGPRWPDMIEPYDQGLLSLAHQQALSHGLALRSAVYVAVLGPNLETRAEYRMLRNWGADVVGMSTVPEAIAAVHCGLKTLSFAVVTDRCLPDALEPADISKIIAAAQSAEPTITTLLSSIVPQLQEM
ncbi:MAG: purine-nucleoside phosphorylase [Planctomycetota bacterium]|nr:MAG: purine-nucleoside phosphorylase [Planctomycetota bacterium]